MSLGYIAALKELTPLGYQPLMLAEINFKDKTTYPISGASNATPIVVTVSNHPFSTGSIVNISGVLGNTAANGVWTVTKIDANNFSLNTSVGNASYISGDAFVQGSTFLFLSSHMLSSTADGGGGFSYMGRDYLPRLTNEDIAAVQALSEQGIDRIPSVTLTITDPSRSIYANYETAIGFKGATMTIRFIFWQANTNNFSTDSWVRFVGICQQSACPDDRTLTVTAVSKFQMAQTTVPSVHVQPTCAWSFPATPAQRRAGSGSTNQFSQFFECGYAPDLGGVGNLIATAALAASINIVQTTITVGTVTGTLPATPFTALINGTGVGPGDEVVVVTNVSGGTWTVTRGAQGSTPVAQAGGFSVKVLYNTCNKTRADCMLRLGNPSATSVAPDGDISHDIAGNATGHFGGIQWQPASSLVSRGYISGKWELIINNSNQAKYGDLVPLAYGTTWVNALVLDTFGDANYTTIFALVCYGEIPYVYDVVVNGIRIPHTYNDGIMPQVPDELPSDNNIGGGWWGAINDGRRSGNVSGMPTGADPFGSLAVLIIQVPIKLAAANTNPSVQIRIDGPKLRVYTDVNTFSMAYSDNPAWVIFDGLTWAGWTPDELDIQSFIDAAVWYATQISFTNKAGAVVNVIGSDRPGVGAIPYARNSVSLGQRQPISVADLLRGLRNNCRSLLLPNEAGLLSLRPKATLADQQPSIPTLNGQTSTNYVTPVPSVNASGGSVNGYVKYAFDEQSIAKKKGSQDSTFRILTQTLTDSPNQITVSFQDAENQYNVDSITINDTEDAARIGGQPITGNFVIQGVNTFDRGQRPVNTFLAENLRGNLRDAIDGETIGDTGGTVKIEFETSFRGIHLGAGDIIMVSNQMYGISQWLFRITSIQPGMNAARIKIQAAYHNDAWYLDTFGQANAPKYERPQSGQRLPYSWCPALEVPVSGDSMYATSEKSFKLVQEYDVAADNTVVCRPIISGIIPITTSGTSPQPPVISMQATTAATGGHIEGGQNYYVSIAAKDVTGADFTPSSLSARMAVVAVPAGTSTNTITVDVLYWDPAAVGYVVFAGISPQKLSYQADVDFSGAPPFTITVTTYKVADKPAPDQFCNTLKFYPLNETIAGTIGLYVVSCTATTITVQMLPGAGMQTNYWTARDLTLFGMLDGATTVPEMDQTLDGTPSQNALPIFNARIASNNSNTFTLGAGLDGNVPDPTAFPRGDGTFGLVRGDRILIRILPTVGSDSIGNYVEDLNFKIGCVPSREWIHGPTTVSACTNANPGEITSSVPHGLTTGDQVYLQAMGGMPSISPLLVTVTVVDSTHFTIGIDTTSAGTYTGGGFFEMLQRGIDASQITNAFVWFISGSARGTTALISSASTTRIYIQGAWAVTPDSTSRFVIINGMPETPFTSYPLANADFSKEIDLQFNVNNYNSNAMGFLAVTVDANGNEALDFNSPYRDCFILGDAGTLEISGGMSINVDGTLGIGSDLGPVSTFNSSTILKAAYVYVKQAPTGADLVVSIIQGSTTIMTLTVPNGTTSVQATSTQLAGATIPANTKVIVDITAVGTTFPASDMTVSLFY